MANQKLFEQRERAKTLQRNHEVNIQRYEFSLCFLSGNTSTQIYGGSIMSAYVLMNILNSLQKSN